MSDEYADKDASSLGLSREPSFGLTADQEAP